MHNVPVERLENKCIGEIERILGLEPLQEREEELKSRRKIKGSLYYQTYPWVTYNDAKRLKEKTNRLLEEYNIE